MFYNFTWGVQGRNRRVMAHITNCSRNSFGVQTQSMGQLHASTFKIGGKDKRTCHMQCRRIPPTQSHSIDSDLNVSEEYGKVRSLRRGSVSRAMDQNLDMEISNLKAIGRRWKICKDADPRAG
eukprot:282054-Ditylum_brightwellii.AAC.1